MKEGLKINISRLRDTRATIINYCRFGVVWFAVWSCDSKQQLLNQENYTGPMTRIDDAVALLSDSAKVIVKRTAPIEEIYANEDVEWKKGMFLQYFNEFGEVVSTFKSNYAHYDKGENLYKGTGDVIVKNMTNGDELNTEELFWDAPRKEFFTDRFVTIRTEDEVHTGEGLTANQNFSSYKILKPKGTFTVKPVKNTSSKQ